MKSIPIALQNHYEEGATTYCQIVRVLCKNGAIFGFTNLDVDVLYDPAAYDPGGTGDDWGPITHAAENGGFSLARVETSADLSVDDSEITLVPGDSGVTEQKLLSGLFDAADVRIYRVNYMDLSQGHECVAVGKLGSVKVSENFASNEYRSLTDLLKEPDIDMWTISCPKKFGVATFRGNTGCPKAFTWATGTITDVDVDEPSRVFDTDLSPANDFYRIGVIEVLTGANAGRQMDIDGNTGGAFALALELPYAFANGDTFRVRKDCSKEWGDAENGCLYHWPTERDEYFGGFPDIPVSDGGASLIPGAELNGDD